ncbi:MAG: hypothetical protein EVJ46_05905 [Candidatus Acididesulfobacter guangdongensis]|uniref:Uncharacterized protein n=1 Tax=Acididesulfobacter guangdongensis TaxID=2597225 RepID=A0A519BH14_ACIG2|nr:MAG: hypothetical protein EVJ46_05905 [Candidatus Acididesulfobacter guangdongensis]
MSNVQAKYPFRFFIKLSLPQLTGLFALNLNDFLKGIRMSDDAILYYHTHHFLLQFHNTAPAAPNDFAYWVANVLGENLLGEQLAGIDMFGFNSMGEFKQKLIEIIENFIAKNKRTRQVEMSSRFNFIKSVTYVMDTKKYAYSLDDFVNILQGLSIYCLYYHFFESSFRLKERKNDFSMWIASEFKLTELADKINNLDPYTHTMNELKNAIIKLVKQYQ